MMMMVVSKGWRREQERAGGRVGLRAHHFHAVHRHPLELVASLAGGDNLLGTALRVLACGCIVQRYYYG